MNVIFTIGYEGTDIDRFIATLRAAHIAQVADVRAVAISRKKGFSKNSLRQRLHEEGITYRHFIELGDPKPGREAARSGKHDLFVKIYTAHFASAEARRSAGELADYSSSAPTVLLCFERDPSTCHRTIIAESMQANLGCDIFNLYADDPDRYVKHAEKLPRFCIGKSDTPAQQKVC